MEQLYQPLKTASFLTLKSNAESNFMARELKTVHIANDATFVKLVLHQCYMNERNLYSQVGVMAVNLCGEPLRQADELPSLSTPGDSLARSLPKPGSVPSGATDDSSFDLRFDAKTAARIREIQLAKDQAVTMEDYDQAKRLKHMEEQLKSIGLQLARLEAQKRDAVANEDYDLAKRVKDEISLLEVSVGSNESQPILPHTSNINGYASPSPTYSAGNGLGQRSTNRSQVLPRAAAAIVGGSKLVGASASASSFSPRDMYPEDAIQQTRGMMARQRSSDGFPGDRASPSRPRHTQEAADEAEEEDESEDPADGRPNPNFRGIPDAENLPDPDEIPAALAKENQALIDVVGLFFTRCFYSNLWNHRDAAIRKVTMDLEQYTADPIPLLEVCSTLVQSGAGDRIAQVALSAFRLVDRMLSFGARVRRDDMCRIVRPHSLLSLSFYLLAA